MGIAVGFLSSLGLNSCGNPASSDIHASLMMHPLLVEKQLLVFALKSQCLVILILLWSERTFCLVLPQKTGSYFLMGTNCLSPPPEPPPPFYFWEICAWLLKIVYLESCLAVTNEVNSWWVIFNCLSLKVFFGRYSVINIITQHIFLLQS